MWQRDGWEARTRIGVLTPHADIGPESEFNAMAPPWVGIHAGRVLFTAMRPGGAMDPTIAQQPVRAFAEPPYVDDTAALLAAAPIQVIAFAFTSSAYVLGAANEASMSARLRERARGLPVVTPCASAVSALQLLSCSRIALVDPPWFDESLNALGRSYYHAAGFEVVYSAPCRLVSSQRAITPDALHAWCLERIPDDAQAVVVGGNGFRAVGVIDALEQALQRPVLTANQVLFWAALRACDAPTTRVRNYGRVFQLEA